jgi:hypothetical protein
MTDAPDGSLLLRKMPPRLKLTGDISAEQVDMIFASYMVDIAHIDEIKPDAVYIIADNPRWPTDTEDYQWLCEIIISTLQEHGIEGALLTFEPPEENHGLRR